MNVVTNAGKVIEMSSSESTKTPQEIASEIIKQVKPDEVLEVLATGREIRIDMRKDGIAIKTHNRASSSWIEFGTDDMMLAISDKVTSDSVKFWLGRFKDLITALKLKKL